MKNKLIALTFSVFSLFSTNAQLEKGSMLIGGSGAFGASAGGNGSGYIFNLYPSAGYFVLNKFAVGAEVGFLSQVNNFGNFTSRYNAISFSPFARYYFLKQESKVNIFAQAGIAIAYYNSTYAQSTTNDIVTIPNVKAGVAYFIRPQVALEAAINVRWNPNVPIINPNDQIYGSIGFQIHLNKRVKETSGI
jgi:hypothetical protein|tara:strand:- start:2815 stop:3387 length:573 start_codon:yes stop_codon:yes gene_type:complete